jgi:adenosyl cobinamide kinase/adenosyl cobinamide phosphate guanylyltransferase
MGVSSKPEPVTFPVDLHITGRLAVVIGGGSAAARRARQLLQAGARVLLIAPEPGDELAGLAARGLVTLRNRDYRAGDLDGAWLVLACTDRSALNDEIAADARDLHIWCIGEGQEAGRRILVLGGARSGKSAAAESMLADAGTVDYVATGQLAGAGDPEWDRRIREHRARRPPGWRTFETLDVAGVLADREGAAPVLVDCLATWLAQTMDDVGLWSQSGDAEAKLAQRAGRLVTAWQQTKRRVVVVSNEVGCGVVPGTESGRRFRDELGWLNARIAASSDEVWLCTAGIARQLK